MANFLKFKKFSKTPEFERNSGGLKPFTVKFEGFLTENTVVSKNSNLIINFTMNEEQAWQFVDTIINQLESESEDNL
jgi:hypothetical protein